MPYEMIRLAFDDTVAVLTLDRPERLNAATPAMFDEIGHALDHLGGARALLITGAGRAFCAGADLTDRAAQTLPPGENGYKVLTEHYNPVLLQLTRLSIPVISAVNGAAAGIGCSLALTADFVIMARGAFLLEAFVNVGLAGDGGAAWTLSRLIGKSRATRMLLLGERIAAQTAQDWGLAHDCVDDAALHDQAMALARRLAAGPTRAIGLIRRTLADAYDIDHATALQREAEVRLSLGDSHDTLEGGRAFLEKRKAVFIGQ
jgi:2-(1,2-epoxy-1,2-dihydrophenyl)acetyl-CoA isomerase